MFFLLLFTSFSVIIYSSSQSLEDHDIHVCDVVLSVHRSKAKGCESITTDVDNDTAASVHFGCSSMEDMLEAIADDLIEVGVNCTELRIPPGEHILQKNYTFTGKNLRVVNDDASGEDGGLVIVHFDTSVSISNSLQELEPLYVWRFVSCYMVEIIGLTFVDSPGIIFVTNVTYFTVGNSSFENFLESSLDIVNSPYVIITNCTFQHCGHNANILKDYRYSIHSGAVSITQNNLDKTNDEPFITIQFCTFHNNSAIPSASLTRSTNQVFANQIFTGRGGALGIAANAANSMINISIINCHFEANTADTWGGSVYIIFGFRSNHIATCLNTVFVRNRSFQGAGGLFIGTLSGGFPNFFSTSNVINCDFIDNQAVHGGGAVWPEAQAEGSSEIIYNRGLYENCRFINNSASNFGALVFATGGARGGYRTQSGSTAIEISNCTFFGNNGGKTPAFGTVYIPIIFSGNNIFDSNIGGAIQIIGCRASVKGRVEIKNTYSLDNFIGALTLTSLAQLMLFRGASLIFKNNTGSLGSSLYAEAPQVSQVFAGTIYNPLCSLLYEDSYIPPDEWEDVEVSFIGNKALVGASVFTSQLSTCSWTRLDNPYFNITRAFRWNFVKFGINEDTFHDEQFKSPIFYVQTIAQRINVLNESFSVYPGENLEYFIEILDELNHPVFSGIQAIQGNDDSVNIDHHGLFVFQPSVYALKSRSKSYVSSVLIHEGVPLNKSYHMNIKSILNTVDFDDDSNTLISISLKECPSGFILQPQIGREDFLTCVCNNENSMIVTCVDESVVFHKDVWATTDSDATDRLFVYHCPTGYCGCNEDVNGSNCYNTFNYIYPDNQCIPKRKGILCGECSSDDEGVSVLLNNCVSCHVGYSSLIPILVFIDVLIIFLMTRYLLCHRYPSWIFPCIFYVQFLPYASSFISNGFNYFHPYMLYVSSALSFYFPYDFCLYNNMSALVSYSLRYIPFFVIVVTSTLVIIYCWYFTDLARSKEWYLIWIFVILNYQFVLYNSMSILNCPTIPTDSGRKGFWYVSGNTECFAGGHIPLALFAILMIILLASMIPVSFLLSFRLIERPVWLKRIQRPLQLWYKEDYRWWFSLELARRFILILMIVPFNGNMYPVVFVYCVTFGLFVYVQPYESFRANLLEIIFSMTTIVFFNLDGHLQFQFQSESSDTYLQRPLLWISAILYYIPFLVTCPLVIIHVCFEVKCQYQKLQKRQSQNRNLKKKEGGNIGTRLYSTANQIKSHEVSSTAVYI